MLLHTTRRLTREELSYASERQPRVRTYQVSFLREVVNTLSELSLQNISSSEVNSQFRLPVEKEAPRCILLKLELSASFGAASLK